jgi:hypothetical protein
MKKASCLLVFYFIALLGCKSRYNKKHYVLTDYDRGRYSVSIDQSSINKPLDTVIKGVVYKTMLVPVKFVNNSNLDLSYLEEGCRWQYIFTTTNSNLMVVSCDGLFDVVTFRKIQ